MIVDVVRYCYKAYALETIRNKLILMWSVITRGLHLLAAKAKPIYVQLHREEAIY